MNITIRPIQKRDTLQVKKLLQDANLSLVWTGFCLAARRPSISALALCCAITVYIWTRSLLYVGAIIFAVYLALYIILRSIVLFMWMGPAITDLEDVCTTYQTDSRTNFWVAVDTTKIVTNVSNGGSSGIGNGITQSNIVGSIAITQKGDPSIAFLRRVAVDQNYRRLGIARKLVKCAISFCIEQNYDAIELVTTEAQKPARKLYEQEGFVYVKTNFLYHCFAMHHFSLALKKKNL